MYGGTVSRCVDSVTPPPLRDAQMLPRPGVTSWTVTFQPRLTRRRDTNSTALPSPPVGDLMESSSAHSATTSVMRVSYSAASGIGRIMGGSREHRATIAERPCDIPRPSHDDRRAGGSAARASTPCDPALSRPVAGRAIGELESRTLYVRRGSDVGPSLDAARVFDEHLLNEPVGIAHELLVVLLSRLADALELRV